MLDEYKSKIRRTIMKQCLFINKNIRNILLNQSNIFSSFNIIASESSSKKKGELYE